MKALLRVLIAEENRLLQLIDATSARKKNAPVGTLTTSKTHGVMQFRRKDAEIGKPIYLRAEEMPLVRALAQKEYDERVLPVLEKKLKLVQKLRATVENREEEQVFEKMHVVKQEIVVPTVESKEMMVRRFLSEPYVGKDISENEPVSITNRGERVRSKSEKIIADKLTEMGIVYKYECPMYVQGYGTVYPDFTILNAETGTRYIWEHLGKMDEDDYLDGALRKIETYEKAGIFPGNGLILTYETKRRPVDTRIVAMLAQRYLI